MFNVVSLDRIEEVICEMFCIVMEYFGVEDVIVFFGLNINGFINSLSLGVLFVMLIDFDKRMMFDLFGGVIVV